ncbi:MAG: FHA domain-containing protein, partial [Deltaproteobacteria bacterium]|nr:FHA domain-containing protein [Deltaproteobacteria bacterium]
PVAAAPPAPAAPAAEQPAAPPAAEPAAAAPESAPEPEAAPAGPPEPLKCPSCDADIPEGFKFCGRCGTPAPEPGAQAAPAAASEAAPAAVPADALGRIIMIQPDGSEGASIPIAEEGITIGRNSGDSFSEDFFLSPEHARFKFSGPGALVAEDLDSLNGVYVRLVPEQIYELNPGDMIRVGQEVVRFELLPEESTSEDGTGIMGSPRKDAWGRLSLIVGKETVGNAYLLEGDEILLGRERGHIIFPEDGYVSGLHLKITRNDGGYQVVDVGSSNGTYLRIGASNSVNSGDYVLMGQYLYKLEF